MKRTDRELLEDALFLIESWCRGGTGHDIAEEIRARLAEPEDEPYAYVNAHDPEDIAPASWYKPHDGDLPLYRHPRQPVRLSDQALRDQIKELLMQSDEWFEDDQQAQAKWLLGKIDESTL